MVLHLIAIFETVVFNLRRATDTKTQCQLYNLPRALHVECMPPIPPGTIAIKNAGTAILTSRFSYPVNAQKKSTAINKDKPNNLPIDIIGSSTANSNTISNKMNTDSASNASKKSPDCNMDPNQSKLPTTTT